MGKILTIAFHTFREAIRNKVLYSLLFFAVALIVASIAFGALAVTSEARLTLDLGVAAMSSFSVIIAIFVGVNLLYKELERKTVYTLLSKPVHRYEFVLGKFVGLCVTLSILVAVMASVLAVMLSLQGELLTSALPIMATLIFFEVVVVTAIAVFFSSFSTPFLSGAFTLGVFLLGRSVPDIRLVAAKIQNPAGSVAAEAVAGLLPNLRFFYVTGAFAEGTPVAVSGTFVDWAYVLSAALYAACYLAIVLALAIVLFSRRDFT